MSHAHGQVQFQNDGKIMFFEYDGTVDYVLNPLRETAKEVHDNWRNTPYIKPCNCNKREKVTIAVDYSNGMYWSGIACREHKCITDGFKPSRYYEDNSFGYPNTELEKLRKEESEYTWVNGFPEWWIKRYADW